MKEYQKPFGGISGSTLKLFAIITMLIDHTGATVLRAILRHPAITSDRALQDIWTSVYNTSRSIGRLAFPVFCFLLVEGFIHTHNVRKYAGRLFIFALISEIPFDIALKGGWYFPGKQNVYFTLLIGLLVLVGISQCEKIAAVSSADTDTLSGIRVSGKAASVSGRSVLTDRIIRTAKYLTALLLSAVVIYAGMRLATYINTDYNYKGVFLIAVLYLTRRSDLLQCITGAAGFSWELPAPLGFIPVYLYNGSRGLRMKYFFYWFYPVHLLILYFAANYVIPIL